MLAVTWMLGSLLAQPAQAEDDAEDPGLDPAFPVVELHRVPPRMSYEFGVSASYGLVAHFRGESEPWVGLGFRGGGGWHLGDHRLGAALGLGIEGEAPLFFNWVVEPQATWDYVGKGLALGASLGPSLLVHGAMGTRDTEYQASVAPSAAVRVGWSQSWTRVGRRLYVVLEPRVRFVRGNVAPTGMIVVGSGSGR